MILLALFACVIVGLLFALLLASESLLESNDLGNSEGDLSDFADGPLRVRAFRTRIPNSEYRKAKNNTAKPETR